MWRLVLFCIVALSFPLTSWSQGYTGTDPCAGVTCSGSGTCSVLRGSPVCECLPGYQRPTEGPTETRLVTCVLSTPDNERSPAYQGSGNRRDIRRWGFGSRMGAGYMGGGFPGSSASNTITVGVGFKAELPSFDFRYFFENGGSLDISLNITTTIIGAAAIGILYLDPYVAYSFNFGAGTTRAIISLGLRLILAGNSDYFIFGLRVPVNLAVEFLTRRRNFGFQIYARPFFHLQPSTREDTAVGGGIMGGIAFMGYRAR